MIRQSTMAFLTSLVLFSVSGCLPLSNSYPGSVQSSSAFQTVLACDGFRSGTQRSPQELLFAVTRWARDQCLIPSGLQLCASSSRITSQVITLHVSAEGIRTGGPQAKVTIRLDNLEVIKGEILIPDFVSSCKAAHR